MKSNLRNYSIWSGNYAIVIPKQHRDHLEKAGWTRDQISQYLFEKAKIKRSEWAEVGKGSVVRGKEKRVLSIALPRHLLIVAAGGPAGGFGAIIPPWLGTKVKLSLLPLVHVLIVNLNSNFYTILFESYYGN